MLQVQIVGVIIWSGPHNIYILSMIYRLLTRLLLILFHKHIKIFAFSTTSYLNTQTALINSPQWSFITCVLVVKTKVTYALAMQGTRASGAIVLYTWLSHIQSEKDQHTHIHIYIYIYIYIYIGPEWHFLYGTTKKVIDNQIWIWKQHKYVWVALALIINIRNIY